ncbi:MAG: MBL fold metallo-hydrolase [Chloroflexi bacterium]|nr:MAG: MBL fold metallo-hydrolase [Chloroflexota bacterium]RLT51012.1 MAG: MBL fold metallo-hydrolase [Chloroflexota bacterium]
MRRQTAWHTIRQLDAETYQISEPLGAVEPRYGVRTVNMYLVLGQVRAVLLDSGMGIGDLRTLTGSITRLPLQIVNTHYHWDHSGGNARFAQRAIHALDAAALAVRPDLGDLAQQMRRPAAQAVLPAGFDVDSYVIDAQPATHQLADGDVLELGGRSLRVLHTPGHTPGHCAFWDQERGMLFSGDAAYQGAMFSCFADCDVQATVESAQCLAALCGVRLVCPGHLDSFADSGWLQQLAAGLAAAASGRVAAQRTSEFVGGREVCFDSFSIWLPLA